MEATFDPGQLLTNLLIDLARRYPTAHGLFVLNSVLVALAPRALFEHPKLGPLLRLMGIVSFLAPHGAEGTFKLVFMPVRFSPPPKPPAPLRIERPSVVQPPARPSTPSSISASEAPTPPEGVRSTIAPAPAPSDEDPTDKPAA
jgi:hypothetical protein